MIEQLNSTVCRFCVKNGPTSLEIWRWNKDNLDENMNMKKKSDEET